MERRVTLVMDRAAQTQGDVQGVKTAALMQQVRICLFFIFLDFDIVHILHTLVSNN